MSPEMRDGLDLTGTIGRYLPESILRNRERVVGYLVAMSFHDLDTFFHLFTTANLAITIAAELRLDKEMTATVSAGALFHDIGKLALSGDILRAPRPLTASEWEDVRRHPAESARLLFECDEPALAAIVRSHHEMLDGSGYPDGLRGSEITVETQIITVADAFDTMRYRRAYKAARPIDEVLVELHSLRGKRYDATIVNALTAIIGAQDHIQRGEVVRQAPRNVRARDGRNLENEGV